MQSHFLKYIEDTGIRKKRKKRKENKVFMKVSY